jgi:serine/threonine-protein kinase HipA
VSEICPAISAHQRRWRAIILRQVKAVRASWDEICDEARLSAADRALLHGRQFLNPFEFYGAPDEIIAAGQV